MDVLMLSRIQFAMTVMFHYLFPPLTIGMGVVLVYLSFRRWKSGDPIYDRAARFWTRIFGLNFAIGVATGIVMEFQFGTNWSSYSRFVGDVFGSALAAEGIFAFFLESGFLSVLVFGWDRVSKGVHFLATLMVSLGSIFSSVWIVVANSWQQTPAGSQIVPMMRDGKPWVVDGETVMRAEITDFWALVFNPSSVHRLSHVLLGAFIMGAFFMMSISAWYLLKRKHENFSKRSFHGALIIGTVASLAIAISGHWQGQNVYRHQPAKMAAMEGHFKTGEGGAGLTLFGIPDTENGEMDLEIAIPGGLSYLIHGDAEEPVFGLEEFRKEDRPSVAVPFFSFRLMITCGFFFILVTLYAWYLRFRGRLWQTRWILWVFVFSVIPGVLANQSGWVAAEVGRQPWIVQPKLAVDEAGVPLRDAEGFLRYETLERPDGSVMVAGLRTEHGHARAVQARQVLSSIIMFGFIYIMLAALWIFVLNRKIKAGPDLEAMEAEEKGR